eukprot:m.161742 g.161742  ORF g.161742 m.161742 type:complete len:52 (+) comp53045_c1_seq4:223-378(+)
MNGLSVLTFKISLMMRSLASVDAFAMSLLVVVFILVSADFAHSSVSVCPAE